MRLAAVCGLLQTVRARSPGDRHQSFFIGPPPQRADGLVALGGTLAALEHLEPRSEIELGARELGAPRLVDDALELTDEDLPLFRAEPDVRCGGGQCREPAQAKQE